MLNLQVIVYIQCLVNRAKERKKVFVTGLKNTIRFLEIARDALEKKRKEILLL